MMMTLPPYCSNLLELRTRYLDRLEKNFSSYGPDTQSQIRGYLPKTQITVLNSALHEVVASLYEEMRQQNRENSPKKGHSFEQYSGVKKAVINHIHSKKENGKSQKTISLDTWRQVFPKASSEEEATRLLQASDQIEDLMCLSNVALTFKLSEGAAHLSNEIDKMLQALPEYYKLIRTPTDMQKSIIQLMKNIQTLYQGQDYSQALEELNKLKKLIHLNT